ncbi:MAG: hypothetical protein V1721_05170 [Pseudomonadota bacterium]
MNQPVVCADMEGRPKKRMKVDKEKLREHAVSYGRIGYRLALRAGFLYVALTMSGLVFGGIGGYWGAEHFGYNAWIGIACALAGIITGGVGGFFLAQTVIIGLMQDKLLDAGIQTGKAGYRTAQKFLKEKKEKEMRDKGRIKD